MNTFKRIHQNKKLGWGEPGGLERPEHSKGLKEAVTLHCRGTETGERALC